MARRIHLSKITRKALTVSFAITLFVWASSHGTLRVDELEKRRHKSHVEFNSYRRRLVIHVGPAKTASTTLQNDLNSLTLEQDSYVYLGKSSRQMDLIQGALLGCGPLLRQALQQGRDPTQVDCWRGYVHDLYRDQRPKQSIILSEEFFSRDPRKWLNSNMTDLFLDEIRKDRDIVVVAVYRRYAEWLLSVKKQADAMECLDTGAFGSRWPWDGGRRCKDVWQTLSQYRQSFAKSRKVWQYYYTDSALAAWEDLGIETRLLNLHSPLHVTQQLLCEVLVDLPKTCRHLQHKAESLTQANVRSVETVLYDSIVFDAATKGLLGDSPGLSRAFLVQSLVEYHQQQLGYTVDDLPLLCPSHTELVRLMNESLALEELLVPEFFASADGETKHHAEFLQLVDRKAFCSVDTAKLLDGRASYEGVLEALKVSYRGG